MTRDFIRFYGKCIKWAYSRGERWFDRVLSILSLILLFGGVVGAIMASYWFLFLGIPILVLIFVVAPYALWRQQSHRLRELTTKRLQVELEKNPETAPPGIWWHLIIRNLSNVPIEGCYGQLLSFTPNRSQRLYEAIKFPWSSYGTILNTETITIAGQSHAYLDIALTDGQDLRLITLSPEPGKRTILYPEPQGTYIAEIQVGSQKEDFRPTLVRLELIYRGGLDLKVELHDNGINQD